MKTRQLKTFLQTMVIAQVLLGIGSVVVGLTTESSLPEPLLTYVQLEMRKDERVLSVVAVALVVVYLIATTGLVFFWRRARILYLVALLGDLFVTLCSGPDVNTRWESGFETLIAGLWGFILALVYFSPLKELYAKPGSTRGSEQNLNMAVGGPLE
jgi:amino acid transporter